MNPSFEDLKKRFASKLQENLQKQMDMSKPGQDVSIDETDDDMPVADMDQIQLETQR